MTGIREGQTKIFYIDFATIQEACVKNWDVLVIWNESAIAPFSHSDTVYRSADLRGQLLVDF